MAIYKIFISSLMLLFTTLNLYADRTSVLPPNNETSPCQTDFDPNSTQITFYGDSLGDLVDAPLYGYFGWEWYLTVNDANVRWDIQNLAVGGNRTRKLSM